jgi:hypothetical protein
VRSPDAGCPTRASTPASRQSASWKGRITARRRKALRGAQAPRAPRPDLRRHAAQNRDAETAQLNAEPVVELGMVDEDGGGRALGKRRGRAGCTRTIAEAAR